MSNYGYGQNPYDQRTTGQAPYPTGGQYDSYGGQQQSQAYGQQPQGYGQQQQTSGRQQYNQGAYNQNQYNQPQMGRDDYNSTYQAGAQNVELEPLAPNGQQYGQQNAGGDILSECKAVQDAIKELTGRRLQDLQQAQRAVLSDPDTSTTSPASRDLEKQSSIIMQEYRELTARMKRIKSKPESGSPRNSAQVGSTSRALKSAINQYQTIDGQYTKSLKEQMARQYRIVRPEASEQEVREAVEDTNSQQVFSQALLQGNRRGQAQSALNAVQSRHEAIQKIERQMIELAELFQDMENMVVQQEAAVVNIEQKGDEVVENMDNGTKQIDTAVKTARATRKKKWWCLAICVIIIIIIVVVILLWQFVFGPNAKPKTTKRWVLPSAEVFAALPAAAKPCSKSHADIVIPEVAATLELVKRALHFRA